MVLLIGGYPIPYADAKAWALRHWPDINIYDDQLLPSIIALYHGLRGGEFDCLCVDPRDGSGNVCFIVVYFKEDPLSTPLKYRRFPEGKRANKFKKVLFNHDGDKELAAKLQFMTVADPFDDYYQFRRLPEELKWAAPIKGQSESEVSAKPSL